MNAINKYYACPRGEGQAAVDDIALADDTKISILEDAKDEVDVGEDAAPG